MERGQQGKRGVIFRVDEDAVIGVHVHYYDIMKFELERANSRSASAIVDVVLGME